MNGPRCCSSWPGRASDARIGHLGWRRKSAVVAARQENHRRTCCRRDRRRSSDGARSACLPSCGRQVAADLAHGHLDAYSPATRSSTCSWVCARRFCARAFIAIWGAARDDRRHRRRRARLRPAVACARPGARISRHGLSSARPAARRSPRPPTSCSTRSRAGVQGARSARLMLVTGLASSIFWPTTSFLAGRASAGAAPVLSMPRLMIAGLRSALTSSGCRVATERKRGCRSGALRRVSPASSGEARST